jgi:aspartate racemase
MKTIGLIGGISSFSTSVYYTTINSLVNQKLGGSNAAKLFLYSVNFGEYKALQEKDDWHCIETMLTEIAKKLVCAGADCILICSNTPHLIADSLRKQIDVPFIHIAEETAKVIAKDGIRKAGLLGTKFTMENSFFTDCLAKAGIETLIPDKDEREIIHSVIINELTKGVLNNGSREKYKKIIDNMVSKGAESIILGCTEIALLIKPEECGIKAFDTTIIHSKAAVDFALSE